MSKPLTDEGRAPDTPALQVHRPGKGGPKRSPRVVTFPPGTVSTNEMIFNLVVEITYWSRAPSPIGMPVARVTLHRGQLTFEPLNGQDYDQENLAPASIRGATPAEPVQYVTALARKYRGSYFWAELRLLEPTP